MFGFGYQELLLVIVLAMIVFLAPGVFYLLVLIGLKALKSPRRVLIALWILEVAYSLKEIERFDMIGVAIFIAIVAVITPPIIFLQFGWLWVAGWVWQRVGLRRIGTVWRNMAALHFRALRPTPKEMTS